MNVEDRLNLHTWLAKNALKYVWTDDPDAPTIDPIKQVWVHLSQGTIISHPWKTKHHEHWQHQWENFEPTIELEDAMMVLEACCKEVQVTMWKRVNDWQVFDGIGFHGSGDSLQMAICLYARNLFDPANANVGKLKL